MIRSKKWHILLSFLTIIALCFVVSSTVIAATGSQGYAVYRNGAVLNPDWHAGVMYAPSSSSTDSVVHSDLGKKVSIVDWTSFMSQQLFIGVYKPNAYISNAGRDSIVTMAKALADDDIGYTFIAQIDYFVYGGGKVLPGDIYQLRCDGVVEYCYEYYGYRIYGSDSLWDISADGYDTLNHHSGTKITPSKQAQYYMTVVQTQEP